MEKEQLLKQNQQLTFDLEKARETIQSKNKEILKVRETFYPVCINFIHSPVFVHSIEWLSPKTKWIIVMIFYFLQIQENILNLEEQIRERSSKLKKMEDNLKVEEEIQSKLASRYKILLIPYPTQVLNFAIQLFFIKSQE